MHFKDELSWEPKYRSCMVSPCAGTDLQIPEAPTFNSLTGFARPGIADKGNPVYKWHNDFVQVFEKKTLLSRVHSTPEREKSA